MGCLYADEHFPLPVVEALRRLGHDAVTIQERGLANLRLPDDAVLAYAHSEGRIVLTQNQWDFIRLHNQGKAHSGIIVCTIDLDYLMLAHRIHQQVETHASLLGQLIRVRRPSR